MKHATGSTGGAWRMRIVAAIALTTPLLPSSAIAQQDDRQVQESEATAPDTVSTRYGNSLIPLPVIFYQPETGTGFGAAVNYLFYLSRPAPDEEVPAGQEPRPSLLSLTGIYTTKKQIITWLGGELYPARGRYWLTGGLGYSKFATKYWGIGNDSRAEAEEDYTPDLVGGQLDILREIADNLYAGLTVQAGYRRLLEVEEGGLLDSGAQPGAENGSLVGIGLLLTWDSRDSNIGPRRGSLLQGRSTVNNGFFGSDYNYASFIVDLRRYFPAFARHAVALRAFGQASAGEPPFDRLPQLGGEILLRGYFQGRFRDRQLLAFQAEYRAPVVWRIGLVAFGAAGQVGDAWEDVAMDRFKTSLGGGLRFLIVKEEGLNIRADFAYGFDVESGSFYLSLGEAF